MSANDEKAKADRRAFLLQCGRFAIVTPPVVSLMLSVRDKANADDLETSGVEKKTTKPTTTTRTTRTTTTRTTSTKTTTTTPTTKTTTTTPTTGTTFTTFTTPTTITTTVTLTSQTLGMLLRRSDPARLS